ncbi:hypothetical protein [Dactylosporangium sp. CA-233914]|uniref:hypothetical protein n=1 Tax=Dactylosporangium sp. CA-233914 TaxID=3239934 RepID=UPI003D8D9236
MHSRYVDWDEAVAVFRERGLPESFYENLYNEGYALISGDTTVAGDFRLTGEVPHDATGYIIDGDLTVEGNVYDEDDGAAALVVLGNLRARDVFLWCDPKLLVLGDTEVGVFAGEMTDKLVMLGGDLRTRAVLLDAEFEPDLVEGTISGRLVAPSYCELETEDPNPSLPLRDLLVNEVLKGDEVDFEALRERVRDGLPVTRAAA